MKIICWICALILGICIAACGATLLTLQQLSTGSATVGILVGQADGSVALYKLGGGIAVDPVNKLVTVAAAPGATFPTLVETPVTSGTANAFACPSGKAPVMVQLNGLGQSIAAGDYTLSTANEVVFSALPLPDPPDRVALWCF